jgi:hypothetical protein
VIWPEVRLPRRRVTAMTQPPSGDQPQYGGGQPPQYGGGQPPQYGSQPGYGGGEGEPPKNKKTGLIIGLVVLAVIIIGIVIVAHHV